MADENDETWTFFSSPSLTIKIVPDTPSSVKKDIRLLPGSNSWSQSEAITKSRTSLLRFFILTQRTAF